MTPFEASDPQNAQQVAENLCSGNLTIDTKPKFAIGDRVRIAKYKKHFEKGYMQNWTKEIFVICEVLKTDPITYKIKDLYDEPILGSFYKEELQKTQF